MPSAGSPDTPGAALVLLARAQRLTTAARTTLEGRNGLPARRRTRAAAVFARSALELVVDAHLSARGHDMSDASIRVRLICLRHFVGQEVGDSATVAWAGLSQGCHQHAYELSPSWGEVSHLVGLVEGAASKALDEPAQACDPRLRVYAREARKR